MKDPYHITLCNALLLQIIWQDCSSGHSQLACNLGVSKRLEPQLTINILTQTNLPSLAILCSPANAPEHIACSRLQKKHQIHGTITQKTQTIYQLRTSRAPEKLSNIVFDLPGCRFPWHAKLIGWTVSLQGTSAATPFV